MPVDDLLKTTDNFIEFVKSEAKKQGKLFFIDSGEGRDKIIKDMYVEDLSGWLIHPEEESTFLPQWQNKPVDEKFDQRYVFGYLA